MLETTERAATTTVGRADRPRRPLRRRLRAPIIANVVLQTVLVAGDRLPSVDALSYFETGRNLLAGAGYTRQGSPELHFPPVAPVSLALLERLTGDEMRALQAWNLGWGLVAVALLTAIAWRLSRDDDVTVATAWIAPLIPGVVGLSIRGGSGSELATVCLLLGAALLVLDTGDRWRDLGRRSIGRRATGAGVLVGTAYLTRPEAVLAGATIGLALVLLAWSRQPGGQTPRLGAAVRAGAAFGLALLVLVGPYVWYQHANTGSWSLTSKSQDASIDAWRAVAEGDRLERDQILYAIQPDGTTLGPETVPLTALAEQHPRGWVTIAWINVREISGQYLGVTWDRGPVWELVPVFVLLAAGAQLWSTRRSTDTRLLVALGAWPLVTCFAFFTLPRYLMMTTAVLIPYGAWGSVRALRALRAPWRALATTGAAILLAISFVAGAWTLLPDTPEPERTEQRTAGRWIAATTPPDARIMTRSFHVQGYSEREVVAMPSAEYPSLLAYARRMGVTHIVADRSTIRYRRPEVYEVLLRADTAPEGLRQVHEFTEDGRRVRIFELDPPAPPTDEPARPLGYVSD